MKTLRHWIGGLLLLATTACSGPGLLNSVDGITGGGSGVHRAAEGVPFGSHGQKLDVWVPDGAPPANGRPVLIFWYGGGWAEGKRQQYGFAARAFADEGFTVVLPDYRKVPDVRYPAFLEDGAQAVAWTRDHAADFGGDPDRIGVAGHSAGAYIAVMLALDQRWTEAAGVPDGTIKAGVGLSGPYDFYPFDQKRSITIAGDQICIVGGKQKGSFCTSLKKLVLTFALEAGIANRDQFIDKITFKFDR